MLTNTRILPILLSLLAAMSLAACGGGSTPTIPMPSCADCPPPALPDRSPTPPDIRDSLYGLAAAADTVIHAGTTPGSTRNWSPGGTGFDSGFDTVIFSGTLKDLGTRAGVLTAESIFRTNIQPGADVRTWTDYRDYAGWMEYSFFYLKDNRDFLWNRSTGRTMTVDGSSTVTTWSIGQASNSRPVSGRVMWTGIMVGVDVSMTSTMGERVEGAAMVEIPDFGVPALDVTFSGIAYTESGESRPSIVWSGLPIDDTGVFGGAGIRGRFYGPYHEEVGGVFLRDLVSGSFGGERQ